VGNVTRGRHERERPSLFANDTATTKSARARSAGLLQPPRPGRTRSAMCELPSEGRAGFLCRRIVSACLRHQAM